MTRLECLVKIVVKPDLDINDLVLVKLRSELGRLLVLHVEIEDVEHRLHDSASMILGLLGRIFLHLFNMLFCHQGRELHDSHDHGKSCALDRYKRLVHVDAHGVRSLEELLALFLAQYFPYHLDKELLRVSRTKIEADSFEDQAFETDDDFSRGVKDLVVGSCWFLWILDIIRRGKNLLGLFDSILHLARHEQSGQRCILVVVLGVAKVESKFVEIRARGIERSNRQLQVLSDVVNQLHTLQSVIILPCWVAAVILEHSSKLELGCVLVRARDETWVRSNLDYRVAVCRRGGSFVV